MIFECYQLLGEFGKTLKEYSKDRVPLSATEEELIPYNEAYDQFKDRFIACIVTNLGKLFPASIAVVRSGFYLEDADMHGATHVDLKLSFTEGGVSFNIKVVCLVFQGRIMLSFDTPEIIKFRLSKRTLRTLNSFSKISDYHYLVELKNLK